MVAIEPAPGHQDDIGLCLTLHQPWASLLCWGVKRIEGRGWHIRHRGEPLDEHYARSGVCAASRACSALLLASSRLGCHLRALEPPCQTADRMPVRPATSEGLCRHTVDPCWKQATRPSGHPGILIIAVEKVNCAYVHSWPHMLLDTPLFGQIRKQGCFHQLQDMEQLYKRLHKEDGAGSPVFPSSYPTGVLVGCVRVVNCLQVSLQCSGLTPRSMFCCKGV